MAREIFTVIDTHKNNREWFIDASEITPLNQLENQSIAAEFGEDVAKYIELAIVGIQNGALTPVKAISGMMRNTKVKRAVVNLLRQGRLVLPL